MKKLKTWQILLVALVLTGVSALYSSSIGSINATTQYYGFPAPFASSNTSWAGSGSAPVYSRSSLAFVPTGFLMDFIVYLALVAVLNFFLKKR